MTLKATYEITSAQELNAAYGMDTIASTIAPTKEDGKQLQGLVHEFEMLAIKLRKLLGTEKPLYSHTADKEFNELAVLQMSLNLPNNKHIIKILDRWGEIKRLILQIAPEFFLTVEEKLTNALSKSICEEIDKQIINDIVAASKK